MEFRTQVSIPRMAFDFSYQDETMLMGSCFTENIGGKMDENKLTVDVNPFGILYNPASIALSLKRLLHPAHFMPDELFEYEGVYHSFFHHSRFSSPSEAEVLDKISHRLTVSSSNLRKASRLIVTFGTAYVYRLKRSGELVSNCHKLPEKLFTHERLSAEAIVDEWHDLLLSLWEQNPELKVVFTVSPVRHWKDGAHHNQLSKAILLLAVEELQSRYPERIAYFPAYEIMMDELRDYRFYADDMLHPSSLAVEYIWERFTNAFLSAESQTIMRECQELQKAISHKPFQPESEVYSRFISQTLLKAEQIKNKFPYIHIENEIELLRSKMK